MPSVTYHRLLNRDLRSALDYYEREGGTLLADRFFAEVEETIKSVENFPERNHFSDGGLRRASLDSFPYHFLYEIDSIGV